MYMEHDTQRQKWNEYASVYDKRRTALMPGYAEMLRTVVEALPFSTSDSFRVLDVGTGTGNLPEAILAHFPNARLQGIDVSEGMLNITKARLERFGGRVKLERVDLEQCSLTGSWDAIVSSLAFHCLSPQRKSTFVQEVSQALVQGGVTIHADVLLLPSRYMSEQNRRVWEQRRHQALSAGLIAEQEIREEEQRRKEYETGVRRGIDDFLSYERFVSYFRENGFPDADGVMRYWGLAVVAAQT